MCKLRIVYDASARSNGSSSNDCLYTGLSLGRILFRFLIHITALGDDIEKAFLMVALALEGKNVLRFLWVDDITKSIQRFNFCLQGCFSKFHQAPSYSMQHLSTTSNNTDRKIQSLLICF